MIRQNQDLNEKGGPGLGPQYRTRAQIRRQQQDLDSSYATRRLKISKINAFAWAKDALIFDIFFSLTQKRTCYTYQTSKALCTFIVPFSLKKLGEPKVLFTLIWPKNRGAQALPASQATTFLLLIKLVKCMQKVADLFAL